MSALLERDAAIRRCWVDPKFRVPEPRPEGLHFPVSVMGVIRDPVFAKHGEKEFVEIVTWWPAARKWTVTYVAKGCEEVTDHEVNVVAWQPPLPLPW